MKGAFSPYLLGGVGWYKRKVEVIEGSDAESLSTTRVRLARRRRRRVRLGKHAGIHGDYRYTFLDFGETTDDDVSGVRHRRGSPSARIPARLQGLDVDGGLTVYF